MKVVKHCRLRGWLYTTCVTGALCLFAAAPGGGAARGSENASKLSGGDGVMAGDTSVRARTTLVEGDETPCMK